MSDYSDVLYDPRVHTHTSCLQEVAGCDMVVLIIGSRFGGKVVPEALSSIDFEALRESGFDMDSLEQREQLSITQYEVLKAIEQSVPIFAFVDDRIWHDHTVYEKNKAKGVADQIVFPSIEKPETARYIFEFINFLRQRVRGNAVQAFTKMEDIESHLRKQWAGLYQRLLYEQRSRMNESRRIDVLTEQLEDLKTAILTSIGGASSNAVARGVVRFRRLVDFLRRLRLPDSSEIVTATCSWSELLGKAGVVRVVDVPDADSLGRIRSALVTGEGTFYESMMSPDAFADLALEWEAFSAMTSEDRRVIVDALSEMGRMMHPRFLRFRNEQFDEAYPNADAGADGPLDTSNEASGAGMDA